MLMKRFMKACEGEKLRDQMKRAATSATTGVQPFGGRSAEDVRGAAKQAAVLVSARPVRI